MTKFIIYRKTDGKIESYSDEAIDFNSEKFDATYADMTEEMIGSMHDGMVPVYSEATGITILPSPNKPPVDAQAILDTIKNAQSFGELKQLVTDLTTETLLT